MEKDIELYPLITVSGNYVVTDYGNGNKTKVLKSGPEKDLPKQSESQPTQDDILTEILTQTTYANCLLELGM